MAKRLFSGIQPSGVIHVGNYLGALKNWVQLMGKYDAFYSVVDYHAVTTPYSTEAFSERTRNTLALLIALGIDPEKCTLFVQSHVPEHTELAWVLGTVVNIGHLERMTQFKEKSLQNEKNINVGLFTYPVLQAADIALYKGEVVPVGEDQLQHLELAREVVRKFNFRFAEVFPEPNAVVSSAPRIRGLDGKTKMSKSLNNTIDLTDSAETIMAKLKTAVTDEKRIRRNDPGDPDVCNLFTMHKGFTSPEKVDEINEQCRKAGIGCVDCKKILAETMNTHLAPIRDKFQQISAAPDTLRQTMEAGAKKCRNIARTTMAEVRTAMGLA